MKNLISANSIIKNFENRIANPLTQGQLKNRKLFAGLDLGTAYIVLAVIDEEGNPVAGAMKYAQVVRDGLVVDFIGAVDIVKELKKEIEEKIGVIIDSAAIAYPPGTAANDRKIFTNVAQEVGFEVVLEIDEPTAANKVLGITDGAIVDIGGGTTGIAVFKNGKVVYIADEPTGGTHFSLVIAGAKKISFEKAELLKKNLKNHQSLLPIVKPVIQKVANIINQHTQKYEVENIYLVGGTCCLNSIEKIIQEELGIPVVKPTNPFLVTPLGIAISGKETQRRGEKNENWQSNR